MRKGKEVVQGVVRPQSRARARSQSRVQWLQRKVRQEESVWELGQLRTGMAHMGSWEVLCLLWLAGATFRCVAVVADR